MNVAASAGGESVGSNTGASSEVVKEEVGGEVELSAMLPHRRRQFLKHQEELKKKAEAEGIATTAASDPSTIIPPDASSLLSTHSSTLPITSLKRTLLSFLALSKPRLTFLVVLSAAASYALFPTDPLLASLPQSPSLPTLTLLYLTIGTSLTSASANTLNMYLEPAYDSQMTRTRNRPLVRGLLTPRQALLFALFTGATGTLALYYGVNPTVSALGAANILLYAGIYTPLKRIHIINTWVGAIVGGIPPLMGWAAAAGAVTPLPPSATFLETSTALLSHPGGWLLFGLLFAWQFPHFNALSYTIRHEYANAGYKMMSSSNPALNARVALRYSFLFFPICVGLSAAGVTDWGFVVTSSVVNGWLVREAWRFWKVGGDAKSARALFWCSVWHLPGVMVLAMVHKSGLWRGVWRSIRGEEEEEYDEDYED